MTICCNLIVLFFRMRSEGGWLYIKYHVTPHYLAVVLQYLIFSPFIKVSDMSILNESAWQFGSFNGYSFLSHTAESAPIYPLCIHSYNI